MGFRSGSCSKESACNARDSGSIPGWGRSPGEGNACLGNPMNREAWKATARWQPRVCAAVKRWHLIWKARKETVSVPWLGNSSALAFLDTLQWHPTPVLLPGESHGRRSLVGCCLWGREESDTTARLHVHFSLSCIGEGNGNPLQCSCLENPREGGASGLLSMGLHRVGHD